MREIQSPRVGIYSQRGPENLISGAGGGFQRMALGQEGQCEEEVVKERKPHRDACCDPTQGTAVRGRELGRVPEGEERRCWTESGGAGVGAWVVAG